MLKLEEITKDSVIKGILPNGLVTTIDTRWIGSSAVEITYKDSTGKLANELLYRDREAALAGPRRDTTGR